MADLSRRLLLAATGAMALVGPAQAEPSIELGAILDRYADAFRAANVEALVKLFTARGSYLLQGHQAAVGPDALRKAFGEALERVRVDLSFDIQEAEKYPEIGWLRATSIARVKVLTSGKEGPFPYNNLVVFEPEGGVWKIRSYVSVPAK